MLITPPQLWAFLSHQCDNYDDYEQEAIDDAKETLLTPEQFAYLKQQDLKPIMADQYVSECHPGGDDLVGVVDEVLAAQRDGYQIVAWYGPNAEVLIAGYRGAQIGWEDDPS